MPIAPIPGIAEPFSSLSHLLGAVVFLLAAIPLLRRGGADRARRAALAIFAFGGVFLLSASGIYHLLPPDGLPRLVLQRIDHAAIFVLIACSFTPIHGILFRGIGRWGVLAAVWSFGIVALVIKTIYFHSLPDAIGLALYIGMGWIGLGSGIVLARHYGIRFVEPIVLGGIAYTVGAVLEFLHWPLVVPGVIQWHEVFHLAVLIGLAFHWAFIYSIADGHVPPIGSPLASR